MNDSVREYLESIQSELVMVSDIAQRLGEPPGTVITWTRRADFPLPVLVIGRWSGRGYRVWLWDEVAQWYSTWKQ